MDPKPLAAILLGAVLLTALVVHFASEAQRDRKIDRITAGMSMDDVFATAGKPDLAVSGASSCVGGTETWEYVKDRETRHIVFDAHQKVACVQMSTTVP